LKKTTLKHRHQQKKKRKRKKAKAKIFNSGQVDIEDKKNEKFKYNDTHSITTNKN
jgi:hypothetical protein